MKVLLRQSKTQQYYAGAHRWTNDIAKAFDFGHVECAIITARDEKLTGVEVVLSFDDGGDVSLSSIVGSHEA